MQQKPADQEFILQRAEQEKWTKVKLAIVDADGILRGKYVHIDKFRSALKKGFGFCNVVFGWDSADVCYENSAYTGWHTGYPDALAIIDPQTYRKVPWDNQVPFFLADFQDRQGRPLAVCPRQVLKRVIKRLNDAGYDALTGMEFEWFNFSETPDSLNEKRHINPTPLTPGMFGYSILRSSLKAEYFNDLTDLTREFSVPLEGIHTETGPGVYEAAIAAASPLEAADRGVLFKSAAKEIAYKHGVMASFMARWNTTLPGCSGHIHQSLSKDGKNLFHDDGDPSYMSPVFKQYLAGQIKYLPEFLVMLAPTINSYKRLVEGFWAPTRTTWGIDNRTCAFRVIPGSQSSTRLESRIAGADVNPYLGLAACLGAGLLGIEEKLDLSEQAITGNAYENRDRTQLATNLRDAASIFAESKNAEKLFGEEFVTHFAASRQWEWQQFQQSVTDWEMRRYFELI